jgi:hypothetical protein
MWTKFVNIPQKRSEEVENRRFGGKSEGPAAGAQPLIGRLLLPWATAPGPCRRWPRRQEPDPTG